MTVLLHLSDTHFGTEQGHVVQALERLVRAQAPGLAVLSGDITQRATPAQFAAARAFIDSLRIPRWVTIPGNHDIPLLHLPARLLAPYGRYRAALGRELAPQAMTADWCVISANTTRWYRHKNGEISAAQVEAIARRLEAAARTAPLQTRLVVVHQPVAVQNPRDRIDLMRGGEAAVRVWAAAGADLVLAGHIHLPFVLPLHQREPLARPMWAVQAGTAVSSRVRPGGPNSVNLLRTESAQGRRRCVVERWDFAAASGEFAMAHADTLDLAPG